LLPASINEAADIDLNLPKVWQSVLLEDLFPARLDFEMAVLRAYWMLRIIALQFAVTVKANRDEVVQVVVCRVAVYVMDDDVGRTRLATETTVSGAPQEQLGSVLFRDGDSFTMLGLCHFLRHLLPLSN